MVPFHDYPNVLVRMLNLVIREPHQHLAIFLLEGNGKARMDFIQNMEYKFVELVSCACEQSPTEIIQHHITYRYNNVKQRFAITQVRTFSLTHSLTQHALTLSCARPFVIHHTGAPDGVVEPGKDQEPQPDAADAEGRRGGHGHASAQQPAALVGTIYHS